MAALTFDSLVARRFKERIEAQIRMVSDGLATGSAMLDDPGRTAMKYNQEIAYVRGLADALVFMGEVEDEIQGRVPEKAGVLSDRE